MKNVLFVGWVNQGRAPIDGETAKNQHIIAELKKYCHITVLDFYKKNKHPWIYLQAIWAFISKPHASIVLSTSAKNVYPILKLFKKFHVKRDILHWVIGGKFGENVLNGKYRADVFNYVKCNLVESQQMIDELQQAGVTNAKYVPNFKSMHYFPDFAKAIVTRKESPKTRFIFLSRIRPDKGCDYIIEAAKMLNEKGLQESFTIDFYGKIDISYEETFKKSLNELPNVKYCGFLDLTQKEGYDILANYHALLFPTFWRGEGFAGIFIDAFIAGVPVLASDWMHNAEIIKDNELGIIYQAHNVDALMQVMQNCINGDIDLYNLAENSRKEASKFDVQKVISKELLNSIGLA